MSRKALAYKYFLFVFPALFFYIVFSLYPILSSFYYTFTNWDGIALTADFIGLKNLSMLTKDPYVVKALKNTFIYALLVTLIQNAAGIPLALALNIQLKSRNFLRMIFFMPAILSGVVISYIWSYMYATNGVLNLLLESFGLADWKMIWLGNPKTALYSVMFVQIWQYVGYSAVIYIANLQSIPKELYEAGYLDGTTKWTGFRYITFPLLAPSVTINVLLSIIGSFKVFELVFIMTKGGPAGASETLGTILYQNAVSGSAGYASAIAVMMFFIIFVLAMLVLPYLRRRELSA